MITFLIVTALVIAFVVGSALAMRPSPRLRRLAELRQRAVVEGLRVQLRPGEREVDYSLGWRVIDAGRAPGIRLAATRGEGGLWQLEPPDAGVGRGLGFLGGTREFLEPRH